MRAAQLHDTTTTVAVTASTVVVEDLNVARDARQPLPCVAHVRCRFGELRRQLEYKAA